MLLTVAFIMQVLALVCLFLAAVGVSDNRISLFPLGMFFWLLSIVVVRT